ncbi:MAG: SoxR reducing system RseC family protein [Gammaproteobacteria bacterium]|jgi:sigma-E factor negative regulatory protein RseC
MIEEVARVLSIENDLAVVAVEKTSGCGSCHAKGACGTSSLAGFFNFKPPAITVKNSLNAKAGDNVLLAMPEQTLLAGSFLLYILPLITMIMMSALVAVFYVSDNELVQIISGIFGFGVGLMLSRKFSARLMRPGQAAEMVKVFSSQVTVSPQQLIS